jgi:hypothetical protein
MEKAATARRRIKMRGAQTPRMTPGPVRMDAAAMIQQSCTAPTTSQLLQKIWFHRSPLTIKSELFGH